MGFDIFSKHIRVNHQENLMLRQSFITGSEDAGQEKYLPDYILQNKAELFKTLHSPN